MKVRRFHSRIAGRVTALALTAAITAVSCPADPAGIIAAASGGTASAFLPEVGKDSLPNVILDMPAGRRPGSGMYGRSSTRGIPCCLTGSLTAACSGAGTTTGQCSICRALMSGQSTSCLPITRQRIPCTRRFSRWELRLHRGGGQRVRHPGKGGGFQPEPDSGTAATGADLEKTMNPRKPHQMRGSLFLIAVMPPARSFPAQAAASPTAGWTRILDAPL